MRDARKKLKLFGTLIGTTIASLLVVWLLHAWFESYSPMRHKASKFRSRHKLEQIWHGVLLWLNSERGELPNSLRDLLGPRLLETGPAFFICSGSGSKLEEGKFVCDYGSLFDRAGFPLGRRTPPVTIMVAWEKGQFFGRGRNAVFFGGRAMWLPEAVFGERLEALDAWIEKCRPK